MGEPRSCRGSPILFRKPLTINRYPVMTLFEYSCNALAKIIPLYSYTGLFSKTLRTPFLLSANLLPFLDLMDYPDSEEEGGTATDGAAMLDDDDTEIGEGMSPAPPGTGAGTSSGNPSTNLRPVNARVRARAS
jgi:hypothetical protein